MDVPADELPISQQRGGHDVRAAVEGADAERRGAEQHGHGEDGEEALLEEQGEVEAIATRLELDCWAEGVVGAEGDAGIVHLAVGAVVL